MAILRDRTEQKLGINAKQIILWISLLLIVSFFLAPILWQVLTSV